MAVRIFRDLMPDLETTDPSTDVYVTLGTGWKYHSRVDCGALSISDPSQIRRMRPLKLALWLDYEKPCQLCG